MHSRRKFVQQFAGSAAALAVDASLSADLAARSAPMESRCGDRGGSLGGVLAATMAAIGAVQGFVLNCMAGGQLTSQVPPDEHRWIETKAPMPATGPCALKFDNIIGDIIRVSPSLSLSSKSKCSSGSVSRLLPPELSGQGSDRRTTCLLCSSVGCA